MIRLLSQNAWVGVNVVANGRVHLQKFGGDGGAVAVAAAARQLVHTHTTTGDSSTSSSSSGDDGEKPSSSSSSSSSGSGDGDSGFKTVYKGFFAANHKRLKLASLVNTAVSLAAAPAIVTLSDASPVARALVAAGAVGFGVGTTAGLHWFTAPYVHELKLVTRASSRAGGGAPLTASDVVRARTLTLLGRPRWTEFALGDVTHPDTMRPLVTFKAKGRSFYVDRESAMDPPELLQWLTPVDPAAVAAAEAAAAAAAADRDGGGGGDR